jgi:hypothetical protein
LFLLDVPNLTKPQAKAALVDILGIERGIWADMFDFKDLHALYTATVFPKQKDLLNKIIVTKRDLETQHGSHIDSSIQ